MTALSKVITSYVEVSEGELDNLAQSICDSLTGNAYFTFTAEELAAFQALITDYSTKLEARPKPVKFTVTSGINSGDLLFKVEANSDATVYLFFAMTSPASSNMDEWRQITSNKSSMNVSGFKPGTKCECRCAYKGSAEQLVYSDIITI